MDIKNKSKLVSIIMPAYKAEKFITKSLMDLKETMDRSRYRYEIICVVDGTGMDKTLETAKKMEKKFPKIVKVEGYLTNMGKGHAVRYGMAKARGDIVGFFDAGPDIAPDDILLLLEHFSWYDADILIGSKRHPASKVSFPWQRRVLSFFYQILVRLLFNLKVRDTQVGMKFFRREVLEKVLPRVLVKEFAFDAELLAVSKFLGFDKIYEVPVEIRLEFGGGASTIVSKGFLRTTSKTLWDTLAVFYRLRILKYYSDKNRKNWITPKYLTFKKK